MQDYYQGVYSAVPWLTNVLAAFTLLYVYSPSRLISDLILGVGMLDEVTVIEFVVKSIKNDLDDFQAWKKIWNDNLVKVA